LEIIQVWTDFLRYLFECFKQYFKESHGPERWTLLSGQVQFVLPHPNGWNWSQHDQMRQAALRAGLVPTMKAALDRIHFVAEGEASLKFCNDWSLVDDFLVVCDDLLGFVSVHNLWYW
jgi:hypothetical protein